MKLIKRGDKYLIQCGIFDKEYLDMSDSKFHFWWYTEQYINQYCLADTEEQALSRLKEYREDTLKEKEKSKTKTIKWFV